MPRRSGLVLYVHGARDRRWAEPFERLCERVAVIAPEHDVAIAFLEHLAPDLASVAAEMSRQGVDRIRVVPMFFGRGGHLRDDFPNQLRAARAAAPSVTFEVTAAAGESAQVLDALAEFAVRAPALPDPNS